MSAERLTALYNQLPPTHGSQSIIPSFCAVSYERLSLAGRAGRSTGGPLHPLRGRVACSSGGDHPACPSRLLRVVGGLFLPIVSEHSFGTRRQIPKTTVSGSLTEAHRVCRPNAMSKPQCRRKRTFASEEDALYSQIDGSSIYRCPQCGLFHLTSQKSNSKNRERFRNYQRRRRRK